MPLQPPIAATPGVMQDSAGITNSPDGLGAPDKQERIAALKVQLGQELTPYELGRLATRQQIEGSTPMQKGQTPLFPGNGGLPGMAPTAAPGMTNPDAAQWPGGAGPGGMPAIPGGAAPGLANGLSSPNGLAPRPNAQPIAMGAPGGGAALPAPQGFGGPAAPPASMASPLPAGGPANMSAPSSFSPQPSSFSAPGGGSPPANLPPYSFLQGSKLDPATKQMPAIEAAQRQLEIANSQADVAGRTKSIEGMLKTHGADYGLSADEVKEVLVPNPAETGHERYARLDQLMTQLHNKRAQDLEAQRLASLQGNADTRLNQGQQKIDEKAATDAAEQDRRDQAQQDKEALLQRAGQAQTVDGKKYTWTASGNLRPVGETKPGPNDVVPVKVGATNYLYHPLDKKWFDTTGKPLATGDMAALLAAATDAPKGSAAGPVHAQFDPATLAPNDKAAWDWAQANAKDPSAGAILQKLGAQ